MSSFLTTAAGGNIYALDSELQIKLLKTLIAVITGYQQFFNTVNSG